MLKEFSSNEYVTIQQIKSLFSRMSSEQRKGTLTEPINLQPGEEVALGEVGDNHLNETAQC